MQKYGDLIMGLISGVVLMLLNNNMVHNTLGSIFTLFDPTNINRVTIFLLSWSSRLIILLSFIGIFITIIYSILILKRILMKR